MFTKREFLRSAAATAAALVWGFARADEGGVSFWLPGQFGSFAAVQASPGWSLGAVYYHTSTDAGAEKQFSRGGRITGGLDVTGDMLFLAPSYAFADPVLGGRLGLQVTGVYGRAKVDVDATLTGPGGTALTGAQSDSNPGVGDLYPMASLKWKRGVHNFMAYGMAGLPVGSYDKNRLANIGTNHPSLDGGGGYTYLDDKTGRELSAVLGFTYNWENPDTHYKNGNSWHLDWAASQFLSEKFHLGLVGYFYGQLSGDSGSGATLGDFKSQVSAIGPQAGWFLKAGGSTWYANVKGFYEFDAKNRPEGWNLWLTLALPLGSAN